jgi:fructose-specific component phosphotransferase system IIB-like protein
MANDFENRIASSVGVTRTDLYTTPATVGKRSMLIGLELANITGSAIAVTVEIWDDSASAYVVLGNGISIPANSTLSFISGQKIVLNESDKVAVTSDTATSLNAIASILEDI